VRPVCPPKASSTSGSRPASRATSGSAAAAARPRSRRACSAPRTAAPPGKAAKRNGYPAIYAAATVAGQDGFFRSIDGGTTWYRINDDAHQWGAAGEVITGDPEIYGRVYLSARGIIYGDIA
jgi:hypothetical protein